MVPFQVVPRAALDFSNALDPARYPISKGELDANGSRLMVVQGAGTVAVAAASACCCWMFRRTSVRPCIIPASSTIVWRRSAKRARVVIANEVA